MFYLIKVFKVSSTRFLTSAQCQATCIPLWPPAWYSLPRNVLINIDMWKYERLLDFPPKTIIIMLSHPQRQCQEGSAGNAIITPLLLHIPSFFLVVALKKTSDFMFSEFLCVKEVGTTKNKSLAFARQFVVFMLKPLRRGEAGPRIKWIKWAHGGKVKHEATNFAIRGSLGTLALSL